MSRWFGARHYRTTTRSNKRLLDIRMPHGNDEARRRSTHIQEKRPKRDKELQTNHTTRQRLIQNTDNNPC